MHWGVVAHIRRTLLRQGSQILVVGQHVVYHSFLEVSGVFIFFSVFQSARSSLFERRELFLVHALVVSVSLRFIKLLEFKVLVQRPIRIWQVLSLLVCIENLTRSKRRWYIRLICFPFHFWRRLEVRYILTMTKPVFLNSFRFALFYSPWSLAVWACISICCLKLWTWCESKFFINLPWELAVPKWLFLPK